MISILASSLKSRYLFFTVVIPAFCSQDKLEGLWEGLFMKQFRMEIHLVETEDMKLSGKIKMFDGSTMIQDDEIQINVNVPANPPACLARANRAVKREEVWDWFVVLDFAVRAFKSVA